MSIFLAYITKRDLHDLFHVRKVTEPHRAKGTLKKGMEEKKAIAVAERTQEDNICSYRLLFCLNIRVSCNCLQTVTEKT